MTRITTQYLNALKEPIVEWKKPVTEHAAASSAQTDSRTKEGASATKKESKTVLVWNAAIEPGMFTTAIDDFGTRGTKVHITTPTMRLESIGMADEETNLEVKNFLGSLYLDDDTIRDYMDVITWDTAKRTTKSAERFQMFSDRWHTKQLWSGFVAFNGNDEPVGVFNIGGSGTAGIAEFACIIEAKHQKKHYGSEAAMLLYSYPALLSDIGCDLPDKTSAMKVTATAKIGHGSDLIMSRLHLPKTDTSEKYGAKRNHYTESIDNLAKVIDNTCLRNRMS